MSFLNKWKGKNNFIQLVNYEVTDKALLQEVISGSMSIKDGRVKEDGYIYMVLSYGEISLAVVPRSTTNLEEPCISIKRLKFLRDYEILINSIKASIASDKRKNQIRC